MACTMLARSQAFVGARAAKAAPRRAATLVVRASAGPQQLPKLQQRLLELPSLALAKPAVAVAVANLIMALPASAEAGKLFDFNLTLPVMASEFLLLMVFLEKFWFTPVGEVLDARDGKIRDMLSSVKDNSGELNTLTAEAEAIIKEARNAVAKSIAEAKFAKQSELDKEYAAIKDKVTKEVDVSIAALEKESAAVLQALEGQVEKISTEVLRRVLPEGVKV